MTDFIKEHILHTKTLTYIAGLVALAAFIAAGYMLFSMPQEAEAQSDCRTVDVDGDEVTSYVDGDGYGGSTDEESRVFTVVFDDHINSDETDESIDFRLESGGYVQEAGEIVANAFGNGAGAGVNETFYSANSASDTGNFTRDVSGSDSISFDLDSSIDIGSSSGEGEASAQVTNIELTACQEDTNEAPNAVDDGSSSNRIAVVANQTTAIDVLANDSDPDNDPLSITSESSDASASSASNPSGEVSYDPGSLNPGAEDEIHYSISDGNGGTDSATAWVKVVENTGSVSVNVNSGGLTSYTPTWGGSSLGESEGDTTYTPNLSHDEKLFEIPKSSVTPDEGYEIPGGDRWIRKNPQHSDETGNDYSEFLGLSYHTPEAGLGGGPTDAETGETVYLYSDSSDEDGSIQSYDIKTGDGTTYSNESAYHAYSSEGDYEATIEVTDNDGYKDTASKMISVSPPPNDPPTADAEASENTDASDDLSASGSSDPDGDNLSYDWEVIESNRGTANIDDPDAENTTASFVPEYGSSASFDVRLTVSDGEYNDSDTTGNIYIPCQSGCGGGGDGDYELK